MQVEITGHHIELTAALKNYVNEKITRLERHFDHVLNIRVILKVKNKQYHKAEATLHMSGNHIFANAKANDMYAAIDILIDKLDRQILKHKEKTKDHHRREAVNIKEMIV